MRITGSKSSQEGQVVLTVVVLMFTMIMITTAATLATITNTKSAYAYEQGNRAYALAETGAENAILRLLRDPTYTGETLTVDDGSAVITVTGTGTTRTVQSRATILNFTRTVQVGISYNSSILTVTSWREVF
jgi:type II secretory pathway component PulK